MGCIYSLTFANGKQYIGMTSELLRRRLAIHRRDSKRKQQIVYRAWRKYGDPVVKTLAVVEKHMLRETERRAIAVFNTMVPNGYNLVAGGEGGAISEETRLKMSLAQKGVPKSAEHRRKISLGQMGRPPVSTSFKMPAEAIQRRADKQRGQKRPGVSEQMMELRARRFWNSKPKEP